MKTIRTRNWWETPWYETKRPWWVGLIAAGVIALLGLGGAKWPLWLATWCVLWSLLYGLAQRKHRNQ